MDWKVDSDVQDLSDLRDGRSLENWSIGSVYVLCFYKGRVREEFADEVAQEAGRYIFGDLRTQLHPTVAALSAEPLEDVVRTIFGTADIPAGFVRRHDALIDSDHLSAIILHGIDSRRSFEDPKQYCPKRILLVNEEVYYRLKMVNPQCWAELLR